MNHQKIINSINEKNYNLTKISPGFWIQLMCIKRIENNLTKLFEEISVNEKYIDHSDDITFNVFFRVLWTYEFIRILKSNIKEYQKWKYYFELNKIKFQIDPNDHKIIKKTHENLKKLRMPFAKLEMADKKWKLKIDWVFIYDFDPQTKDCSFIEDLENHDSKEISIKETIKLFNETLLIFKKYLS